MIPNHLKDNKAKKMDVVCKNKRKLKKDSTMVPVDDMFQQDMLGFASKFLFQFSCKQIMTCKILNAVQMHKI